MKRNHTLIVTLLSLFVFLGQGGEDVMKNLDTFQQSLAQWMRSVEGLNERIRTLERVHQQGGSPELMKTLSEVTAGISALRKEITDSSLRLTKLEETLGGTKTNPMVVFGETLNILKKNVTDLLKRLEDQEALTSVMERRMMELAKPMEPIRKALEEERKLAEALAATIEEHKKELESRKKEQTAVRERLGALETSLGGTENGMKTVEIILKRLENIEKQTGVAPPPEVVKAEEKVEEAAQVEVKPKTPEEEGFREIGAGFYVRNVVFTPFGASARATGELKNLSNNDYSLATFNIKVYDLINTMVSSQDFTIKDFRSQDTKSFREIITGADPQKIGKYTISFKEIY